MPVISSMHQAKFVFEALFEYPDKLIWNIFTRVSVNPDHELDKKTLLPKIINPTTIINNFNNPAQTTNNHQTFYPKLTK